MIYGKIHNFLVDNESNKLDNSVDTSILLLWKAFCRSRKAMALEYQSPDAVIDKWNSRFKIQSENHIKRYIHEYITVDGHVLDDPF